MPLLQSDPIMIEAGAGTSMLGDSIQAVEAAAEQARQGLASGPVDLAFMFATTPHAARLEEAARALRQATGSRQIVGCLGGGVFTLDSDVEGGAGISVLLLRSSGELSFDPIWVEELEERSEDGGAQLGRRLRPHRSDNSVVLLFPDIQTFRSGPFFEGMEREGGAIPVVGGASCDDGTLGRAYQILGDRVGSGVACGVMIRGDYEPAVLVTQSCLPAENPLRVTRTDGNLVVELDGRRAFDAFLGFVRDKLEGDLQRVTQHAMVAIFEEGDDPAESDYFVRQIIGVDPEQGVLALSEPALPGQRISFILREPADAWKHLQGSVAILQKNRPHQRPAFGLYFNCAARKSQFFGTPSLDTSLIKDALGDFPLVGFYGASEFAPLAGRNRANFFSGVLFLVYPAAGD